MIESQVSDTTLFTGKRVALVGPSQTLIGNAQGRLIDSFDLVVRINHQWPIPTELKADLGTRMDVLYHCCNGDYSVQRLFNAEFSNTKQVFFEKGLDAYFLKKECAKRKIPCSDITAFYADLVLKTRTYPNTGLVAIYHLLQLGISELYITGLTFFQKPYYAGYHGTTAAPETFEQIQKKGGYWRHSFAPQLRYFAQMAKNDSRIEMDPELNEIVESQLL